MKFRVPGSNLTSTFDIPPQVLISSPLGSFVKDSPKMLSASCTIAAPPSTGTAADRSPKPE